MIDLIYLDGTHARITEWAKMFCAKYPRYLNRNNAPDIMHISKAIEACGYHEVNAANVEHVKQALEQRAASK
jgi:hypothetical protein